MKLILPWMAILLLAGCARFEPQPLSPADTAARLESRSLTNAVMEAFLEKNLHRPWTNGAPERWDFDMLTLAAYYYNPSLDVARADWQVAVGGTETAAARPNPSVTFTPAYDSQIPGSPSPWILPVSFDIPIETAGKRGHRMEQARFLSESARLNLASTAWQVRCQLRSNLVDFCVAQKRVELLEEEMSLNREISDRLHGQAQAGAAALSELTVAQVALARAGADLADARRQLAEARAALAEAIGIPASALNFISISFELSRVPAADTLTSAQARGAALRSRTDILAALSDYAASQAALQLEIARQYPDVHLGPGYAWNQGNAGDNEWSLGFTVALPILDQNKGPIAEASARRTASAARFLALQAGVINEIDRATAVYEAVGKSVGETTALCEALQAQEATVTAEFKAGAVDQLELLNAKLGSNAAALAALDVQDRFQQAFGALESAVQRPLDFPEPVFRSARSAQSAQSTEP